MTLNWQQNTTVFDTVHHLKTQHGPALAVLGSRLYMVYVGDNGTDLWYAWIDTAGKDFSVWNGNYRIKTAEGRNPKSSYQPAIAVVDGILHIVYASQSASSHGGQPALWWSWFDGQGWHGDVKIATMAGEPRPAMATRGHDRKLHLVYQDGASQAVPTLRHSTSIELDPQSSGNWGGQSWGQGQPIGAASNPALVPMSEPTHSRFQRSAIDLQLFAELGVAGTPSPLGRGLLADTGPVNLVPISAANPPSSDGGESGAVLGGKTYVVYRGSARYGVHLWYLTIDPTAGQAGNDPVVYNTHAIEASAVPSVAAYNGKLCLAYKKDNTSDLMFAWAD